MKYNLSIKNGQYCLEIIDNIDNKKRINRIYDQTKIFDIISEFTEYADSVVEYNGNMKFIFEDKIITLMEFEKYKDKNLYSFIHDSIDDQTRIIRRVEHINKKKILAIALTSAVILTLTVSGMVISGNEKKMNNNLRLLHQYLLVYQLIHQRLQLLPYQLLL